MSKLICPQCGAEVILPEKSSFITGVTLAENTDNNTYYLKTKENSNMGKVAERLETLKNNGIDVSKFFSVSLPSGEEIAMRIENGTPIACNLDDYFNDDIDDEIESEIFENGYVKNTRLHRRWVMAQMFHALEFKAPIWNKTIGNGFTGWLYNHGYSYQWRMAIEEFRVISKLEKLDAESFKERSMFFNCDLSLEMIFDYEKKLHKYIDSLKRHSCKGITYIKLPKYGNIFVSDLNRKIYMPISRYKNILNRAIRTNNYAEVYRCLNNFYKFEYIELPYNTKMSNKFVDAYKGSGAYFTLKNMFMFHNCKWGNRTTKEALNLLLLTAQNDMDKNSGYKLLGLLKYIIDDNCFDFKRKMSELNN